MNPECKELHIDGSAAGYRSVLYQDNEDSFGNPNIGTIFSQWVDLVEGQMYYIEASHIVDKGTHHLTVGVEIEGSSGVGVNHPKTKPQR